MNRLALSVASALTATLASATQPVDLYCEIEGSAFVDEARKIYPAAGTLVFRIDPTSRTVLSTAGLFSHEPLTVTEWREMQIKLEQRASPLAAIPGIVGTREIRIDRTTGRFTVTEVFRDDERKPLTQADVERRFDAAGRPGLGPPKVGPSLGGQCGTRSKLF